jgi:hypothetical protein
VERTEGNPLFIEELVRAWSKRISSNPPGRGFLADSRRQVDLRVPATIQGVLTARMERLSQDDRALLQTLSVMGKEFPAGLVRSVIDESPESLRDRMARLEEAEFVYERPALPEGEYVFKHALTQEVAYQSLLSSHRHKLHEMVAVRSNSSTRSNSRITMLTWRFTTGGATTPPRRRSSSGWRVSKRVLARLTGRRWFISERRWMRAGELRRGRIAT